MTSGLLGPEWYWQEPRTIAMPNGQKIVYSERERGRDVFGNLYVYYQWEKPSPLMAVAFFTIGYAGTRLRNPDVKAKALGAFGKLKLWLHRKKLENATVKAETKIDGVKTQEAK